MKLASWFLLFWTTVSAANDYYLFELHKHKFIRVEKLAPQRLYAHWEPQLRRLVFRVTNEQGKFLEEGESLMVGSVLDGKWIGGDPGKRYELKGDGKWARTEEPEHHFFWHPGEESLYSHHRFTKK